MNIVSLIKFIPSAGAILFCAAISSSAAPSGGVAKQLVASGIVQEVENMEVRRYTGQVISPATVALTARVSGELLEVGFKEGDFVKKGQLLYRLDNVRYVAAVRGAEAKIEEYKARVLYAKNNFERTNTLFEKQVSTQDEMESARAEYQASEAALLAAQADLILAQDDLKNTRIVAPIDGRIGVNNYTVGNYIAQSSGTLAEIVQLDPVRVKFSLSNRDLLTNFGDEAGLRADSEIHVKMADGREYEVSGTIEFVDNSVNRRTDSVQVFVLFGNARHRLIPGSTLTVLVARKSGGAKFAAVVPSAVMHDSQGAYVYVLDAENTVARRDIVLGGTDGKGHFQLVKEGLKPGERVIVDGTHKALPGAQVNVAESR